jgi:hypothetical protein
MEMFASNRKVKNMRKTKIKSAKDVVQKINTWIKKVDERGIIEVLSFADYIVEEEGVTISDKLKTKLLSLQQKKYTVIDIENIAKKYKVKLDGEPVGGSSWGDEWQIAVKGGINISYNYNTNDSEITGWKIDKQKLRIHKDKYAPADARMNEFMRGKRVSIRGFETAFELIGEEYNLTEAKKKTDEEAPANSVSSGGVDLSPHKRKKKKIEIEEFAGKKVFVVSAQRFWDSRLGKAKYSRYEKYVGNDEIGEAIRVYGRTYPKRPIILKNSGNGAMLYLKYGKTSR